MDVKVKRILSLLLVLVTSTMLATCGSTGNSEKNIPQTVQAVSEEQSPTEAESEMLGQTEVMEEKTDTQQAEGIEAEETKILAAYFLRAGENYC